MSQRISVPARLALFFVISMLSLAPVIHARSSTKKPQGKTRTYYIAADEVNWNYAPSGRDEAMGMPFDEISKLYTEPGPHRIGGVYKKAVYREYTDASNATHPYSMHPLGVFYQKDSEGADYNDATGGADKSDGGVPPGATHTYTWEILERSGPGPNDPSSVFWLYHSHADELRDVASGLFGGIVVTRRGMALPDGRPRDVDHEFVT